MEQSESITFALYPGCWPVKLADGGLELPPKVKRDLFAHHNQTDYSLVHKGACHVL